MRAFHNSSAAISKICVVLFSVLIASALLVGCVDKKERSAKGKAELLQSLSELSVMQDKVIGMMERGETDAAKKFAETTVAEKRTDFAGSVEDKAMNQIITEEDHAFVLKEFADKEKEFLKKMSAFQTK